MILGFSATPMDMSTGTTVYASPDERLTHSACCDLYHYYGIPVWGEAGCSDSKLLDAIREVGPGGTFLIHDQPAELCRTEHWRPQLINRKNPEVWAAGGGKRYSEVVKQKTREIIANHKPKTLPPKTVKALAGIYQTAGKTLTEKFLSS